MLEAFRKLVYLIYCIAPRRNHAVIYGWPDGEDNTHALEGFLRTRPVDRAVILVNGEPCGIGIDPSFTTLVVRKNSCAGLLWFLTARYVFFTHRCFMHRFPPDVVSVNLWHGMPIKKIGKKLPGSDVIESSHLLATSPFWATIMRDSMSDQALLLNTGLPRNDLLFTDPRQAKDNLGLTGEMRLMVWLPTYRHSVRGAMREDGCCYGNIFEFPDIDAEQLNAFLKERNVTIYIKPHPMAMSAQPTEWSNLIMIDDPWLSRNHLTLYTLLAASNALISDVSSVVIDYLLLDRPIIHAFADVEEYRNSRGFSVEPIEDYFCGPVVGTQDQLMTCVERVLNDEDPECDKRRKMLELSHTHRDGKATERLLKEIGL